MSGYITKPKARPPFFVLFGIRSRASPRATSATSSTACANLHFLKAAGRGIYVVFLGFGSAVATLFHNRNKRADQLFDLGIEAGVR